MSVRTHNISLNYRAASDEEIALLLVLAGNNFVDHGVPETLWHVVEEVKRHRADARARWQLPPLSGAVLSIGRMNTSLERVISRGAEAPAAIEDMQHMIREVVHLREQLTRAQGLATKERDLRIQAQESCQRFAAEVEVLREALVKQPGRVAPVDKRSARWIEAEARISEAVDKGQDPNPADMAIVLEEKTREETPA